MQNNILYFLLISTLLSSISYSINLNSERDSSNVAKAHDLQTVNLDSCSTYNVDSLKKGFNIAKIQVSPISANDATIQIIQKSVLKKMQNISITTPIEPTTIGTWKAPLNICLQFGDYKIKASKKGFEDLKKTIRITNNRQDKINIQMISFEYIKSKRKQWATTKWISASVSILAGAASFYFSKNIDKLQDEYNTAYSPDIINEKRDNIKRNQNYYKISTGIAFAGLSGFTISWAVEFSYLMRLP